MIRQLPAYLNGRPAEEWVGTWVRADIETLLQPRKTVEGLVSRANAHRTEDGMVLYLTIAVPDGFLYPGVDARNVVEVERHG